MKVNGTFKTKEGKVLDFGLELVEKEDTEIVSWSPIGYAKYYVYYDSNLTINGHKINTYPYFQESKIFHPDAYFNSKIESIDNLEISDSEYKRIYETVKDEIIEYYDADYFFDFGIESLEELEIEFNLDQFLKHVLEEQLTLINNESYGFKNYLIDLFELVNGNDGLFQLNRFLYDITDNIQEEIIYTHEVKNGYRDDSGIA